MTEQNQLVPFWKIQHLPAPETILSTHEFRALPETSLLIEHINGRVHYPTLDRTTMTPAPTPDHQRIVRNLIRVIEKAISSGEVIPAPADLYLGNQTVQPDVFWMAENSTCIEHDKHFEGAPELIVEVHSPSTALVDKKEKFELYQQHQVEEYWMIDPNQLLVEVYTLKQNQFVRLGVFGSKDTFKSPVLANHQITVESVLP